MLEVKFLAECTQAYIIFLNKDRQGAYNRLMSLTKNTKVSLDA